MEKKQERKMENPQLVDIKQVRVVWTTSFFSSKIQERIILKKCTGGPSSKESNTPLQRPLGFASPLKAID